LLGDPGISRVACHGPMHDAPRGMLEDEKGEHGSEEEIGRLEKVARPDASDLVAEEGRPGLSSRLWRTSTARALLNRALGHANAQLQEFTTDALGSPVEIVGGHLLEKGYRCCRQGRPTHLGTRLPSPEQAESLTMPAGGYQVGQ